MDSASQPGEHEIAVCGGYASDTRIACRCGERFRQHGSIRDGTGQLLAWLYFHASDEQREWRQLCVSGAVDAQSCPDSPECVNGPLWHLVSETCGPEHVHEWLPFHDENGQQSCACGATRPAGIQAARARAADHVPGTCRGNGECTC